MFLLNGVLRLLLQALILCLLLFTLNGCASSDPDWVKNLKSEETHAKQVQARALFKELCATRAGEHIYHTAENVEGILLLKVRPNSSDKNWRQQMYPGAAFAKEFGEDGYITSFLSYERTFTENPPPKAKKQFGHGSRPVDSPRERGQLTVNVIKEEEVLLPGYRYVDVLEPGPTPDSPPVRYRYTGYLDDVWKKDPERYVEGLKKFKLKKELAPDPAPRYAVTYEDSLDPNERQHWIAGSTVKVIDTHTNTVMAEFTRYVYDHSIGFSGQGFFPWLQADRKGLRCPEDDNSIKMSHRTRYFVDQVLKPAPFQPFPVL